MRGARRSSARASVGGAGRFVDDKSVLAGVADCGWSFWEDLVAVETKALPFDAGILYFNRRTIARAKDAQERSLNPGRALDQTR